MSSLVDFIARKVARRLGFPPGTGSLIDARSSRKFLFSLAISVALAILDLIGVLAMLPMMQVVTLRSMNSGALGVLNRMLGHPSVQVLIVVIAGTILTVFVAKDVLAVFFRRWQLRFLASQEVGASVDLLRGYLVGPYHWHLVKNTSDKLWIIESAVQIGFMGGIGSAMALFTEIITISMIMISLMVISPWVTLGAAAFFGLALFLLQRWLRPRVAAASARGFEATRVSSGAVLQSLGAAKEIKIRGAEEAFVDRYAAGRQEGAMAAANSILLSEMPRYLLEVVFIAGIGVMAILLSLTNQAGGGFLLLGVFIAASTRILPSVVRMIAALNGIRAAREPLRALILERDSQEASLAEEDVAVRTDRVPRGEIRVEDVTFAYRDQPDTLVLDHVNLDIPEGSSVAIVGASGSGKSTLVDTILGLHKPTKGAVTAGGVDVRHNLPEWRTRVGVVPQDIYLLDATLRENVVFDGTVDEARLARAIEQAQLLEMLGDLPAGLDTRVGERGARLSGGQRQRVGIARALYRGPEVLFLDEATSALDNETERRFTDTITALHGQLTMVIVAHRLSTVRHCDSVVFMRRGRVDSVGTFDEVVASSPEFARLVELSRLGGTLDDAASASQV